MTRLRRLLRRPPRVDLARRLAPYVVSDSIVFTAAVCGPDDVLVLSTPTPISPEQAQRVKDKVTSLLGPEVRMAVISGFAVTVVLDPSP